MSVSNWNSDDSEEKGEFVVMATNIRIHPKYKLQDNHPEYDFAILDIPDLSTVSRYKKYYKSSK